MSQLRVVRTLCPCWYAYATHQCHDTQSGSLLRTDKNGFDPKGYDKTGRDQYGFDAAGYGELYLTTASTFTYDATWLLVVAHEQTPTLHS
jgi:hypothetical protein